MLLHAPASDVVSCGPRLRHANVGTGPIVLPRLGQQVLITRLRFFRQFQCALPAQSVLWSVLWVVGQFAACTS